jgi:hypothetical protein
MIQYVQGDVPLEEPESGLKIVALVGSGHWPRDPGSLTARIADRWPGKLGPEGWHRACFRWMKTSNDLGDLQWTCVESKVAICFMISEYTRHGVDYEILEGCLESLGIGTRALAKSQDETATIHMLVLDKRNEFEWMIQDHLEDFDVLLYE